MTSDVQRDREEEGDQAEGRSDGKGKAATRKTRGIDLNTNVSTRKTRFQAYEGNTNASTRKTLRAQ